MSKKPASSPLKNKPAKTASRQGQAGSRQGKPGGTATSSVPPSGQPGPLKKNRRGGRWLFLIVVLAILGGGAWTLERIYGWPHLWWTYIDPHLPKPENPAQNALISRLEAVEKQISSSSETLAAKATGEELAALRSAHDDLKDDLDQVVTRLAAAESAVMDVRRRASAGTADDGSGLSAETLREITDRLAVLEAGDAATANLSGLVSRLDDLEMTSQRDRQALEAVRSRISTMRGAVDGTAISGVAILLSVDDLKNAIGRGDSYATTLETVARLLDGQPRAAAPLSVLRRHAQDGVATLSALQTAFSAAAAHTLTVTADEASVDQESWLGQTLKQIKRVVRISKTRSSAAPGSSEAAVFEAEARLRANDLAGAVSALAALEGAAATAMADWRTMAGGRLEVDEAVAVLRSVAVSDLIASGE